MNFVNNLIKSASETTSYLKESVSNTSKKISDMVSLELSKSSLEQLTYNLIHNFSNKINVNNCDNFYNNTIEHYYFESQKITNNQELIDHYKQILLQRLNSNRFNNILQCLRHDLNMYVFNVF